MLADKLLEAAGNSSTGSAVYVEDVFSTYLYTGNNKYKQINSGISLQNTASYTYKKFPDSGVGELVLDAAGNMYVSSYLSTALVIRKIDTSGSLVWGKSIAVGFSSSDTKIKIDTSGNVYVAARSKLVSTTYDIYVVKLDASGSIIWQRCVYNTTTTGIGFGGLDLDASGNAHLYLSIQDIPNAGSATPVLIKFDVNGATTYQKRIYQGLDHYPGNQSLVIDKATNTPIITGMYYAENLASFRVIKVAENGSTLTWQKNMSAGGQGMAVALDSTSNVYVAGYAQSSNPSYPFYLIKYDSSGALLWQRRFDVDTNSNVGDARICVDADANVYVSAFFSVDTNVLAKYNSTGTLLWSMYYSSSYTVRSLQAPSDGNLYVGTGNGVLILRQDGTTCAGVTSEVTLASISPNTVTPTYTLSNASTTITSVTYFTISTPTLTASSVSTTYTTYTQAAVTGAGGMVWIKGRSGVTDHALYDTSRGATKDIVSNSTAAQSTQPRGLIAFGTNLFGISNLAKLNTNNATYTSWVFKKQPKFFDIVTYTGTGSAGTISHNLGSTPGMIIVKPTSGAGAWAVYHRGMTSATYGMQLNSTSAQFSASTWWNDTAPTSSAFSLGTNSATNANGTSYVAYLFAHDAGGFGASGTDSVTACGSYTGNGSASGPTVTLGWEPQYVLVKMSSSTGDWNIFDNMRGIPTGSADPYILANTADTEATTNGDLIDLTPTGFTIKSTNDQVNTSGGTYIYLAIRRGPMKTPTDATKVFSPNTITPSVNGENPVSLQFAPDMVIGGVRNGSSANLVNRNSSRLTGAFTVSSPLSLLTNSKAAENNNDAVSDWLLANKTNNQFIAGGAGLSIAMIFWNFRRAPGFFDVVCYTGTGANRTVSHNLGVVPELIIVKRRSAASVDGWLVYSAATGNTKQLFLNTTDAAATISPWNNTSPTASVFSLSNSDDGNNSGTTYVAYLFASCPGVSKVGSYTGSGTTKQIDCGFSAGARFVLIKRTDSTGGWYVWDTARGLVSGNDPYLLLNSTAAEATSTDYIDPYSAGFEISSTAPAAINASGGTFIYLAIA